MDLKRKEQQVGIAGRGDTAIEQALEYGSTEAADHNLRIAQVIVPVLALAVFFGAAVGMGGKTFPFLAVGGMGGLILLFAPLRFVLGVFVILTFLIVGPARTIGHIAQAEMLPPMLALVLLIRVPMEWYHSSTVRRGSYGAANEGVSPIIWAVVLYFAVMAFSFAINRISPSQGLVGAKLYVFTWGIFFLLVVSSISPRDLERLWRVVLLMGVLQFPFALYQRLFVVPSRANALRVTALDAIVGTFGGTELDGGANGAMCIFVLFSTALAVSLWRNKQLGGAAALLVVLASVGSIALGEVKAIIVFIPLGFIVLNRREVLQRPLYFIGMGLVVTTLLGAIFLLYADKSSGPSGRKLTLSEHLEKSFGYVLNPNEIHADRGGEVGRVAALNLWYRDGRRTPQSVVLGYGPAASHDSKLNRGEVASRHYPLVINQTTAAGMLWDVGVLGFASFATIMIVAFFQAIKLANRTQIPPFHRGVLEACAVLFALSIPYLPYDNDFLITPQFQILFLVALAHVVYWHSRAKGGACLTPQ